MEGLEPPHLAASDPKSDVSTNFTTCAFGAAKVMDFSQKNIANQKPYKRYFMLAERISLYIAISI